MRNKYPGYCYRCGGYVGKGEGHFERKKVTGDCSMQNALLNIEVPMYKVMEYDRR